MPIYVDDKSLDARLDALRDHLAVRPSRSAAAAAILDAACVAFETTGDPEAWRAPAHGPTNGAGKASGASAIRDATDTTASNGDSRDEAARQHGDEAQSA